MSIWVDGADGYLAACKLAAENDEAFANFKRDKAYLEVTEHVPCSRGMAYLLVTLGIDPWADFGPALVNDRFGNPFTYEMFDDGMVSPTTCRYLWTRYMLAKLFGPLAGQSIIEIGGGYGGLAVVLQAYEHIGVHAIADLYEPCLLQRRYAEANGYNVTSLPVLSLHPMPLLEWTGKKSTLAISTYGFCELTPEQQEFYVEHILRHVPRGFFVCNDLDKSTEAIIRKLNKPGVTVATEPVDGSYMLWWGANK